MLPLSELLQLPRFAPVSGSEHSVKHNNCNEITNGTSYQTSFCSTLTYTTCLGGILQVKGKANVSNDPAISSLINSPTEQGEKSEAEWVQGATPSSTMLSMYMPDSSAGSAEQGLLISGSAPEAGPKDTHTHTRPPYEQHGFSWICPTLHS